MRTHDPLPQGCSSRRKPAQEGPVPRDLLDCALVPVDLCGESVVVARDEDAKALLDRRGGSTLPQREAFLGGIGVFSRQQCHLQVADMGHRMPQVTWDALVERPPRPANKPLTRSAARRLPAVLPIDYR